MILEMSLTVFVSQLIFIGCRTWNVRAVADRNLPQVLLSGGIVHLSWLASLTVGAMSMQQLLTDWNWAYLPVIACSLAGGLIGSWLGLKEKIKNKKK